MLRRYFTLKAVGNRPAILGKAMKMRYHRGDVYEGQFKNDRLDGTGVDVDDCAAAAQARARRRSRRRRSLAAD